MADRVLITGGAGFIGRHLAKALIDKGDHVRVLDAFIGQVHADRSALDDLGPHVEVQEGDVRDGDAVARALQGVDEFVDDLSMVELIFPPA